MSRHVLAAAATVFMVAATGARAAGPFDGTYNGTTHMMGAGQSTCAVDNSRVRITIVNNQFVYNHFGTILTGTVADDGSFTGSGTNKRYRSPVSQSISGKVSGSSIDAETESPGCKYHLEFRKS